MKTREQKRLEAEERLSARAQRAVVDQISLLDSRTGRSKKERARLLKTSQS